MSRSDLDIFAVQKNTIEMARRHENFSLGEWYHCFTRGVDKRNVFASAKDYERFEQLLYLCNTADSLHRSDLTDQIPARIFTARKSESLVSIGAYCLMPNHFHLLLCEKQEGGISKFMQKLGIAYTMYFNIKNERIGNLFVNPFRSRHVDDDRYLRKIVQYIHLNPAELYEPEWKKGRVSNLKKLLNALTKYKHSSLFDFEATSSRPQLSILDQEAISFFKEIALPAREVVKEAALYYEDLWKGKNVKI